MVEDKIAEQTAEERTPLEQNKKLPDKKKKYRSGKNISRICTGTLLKSLVNLSKIINSQLDIMIGQFTEGELDAVPKKNNLKSIKAVGFNKIPPKV